MRTVFLLLLVCLLAFNAYAQINDTVFQRYSEINTPEKTYLHFDKSGYVPGETIWFKAYLTAAHLPSDISKNFYADWYDYNGKLLQHMVMPIVMSTARNQFNIPSGYKGRTITLKAYTQWMLNFDTAFLFSKTIPVVQSDRILRSDTIVTRIELLPEGGNLVDNIESKVAFKATDQSGRPVTVSGVIRDDKGIDIGRLITQHDGMGSFNLKPQPGKRYSVEWQNAFGEKGIIKIPAAIKEGFVLSVASGINNIIFNIERSATATYDVVHLVATMQNRRIYQAAINLSRQSKAVSQIPTASLPEGVIILTVFDKYWKPIAERAAFVRKLSAALFVPEVKGVYNTNRRGKNELEIKLTDTVNGTFSVAVTDADVFVDSSINIFSHLLLSADIKGKVNNPSYYFQNTNDSTLQQLDLVMMTNGWRKIEWSALVSNRLPVLLYPPETEYMQFTGKVTGLTEKQLKEAEGLTLFIERKDSSKNIFPAYFNEDGTFNVPDMLFADSVNVFYQFIKGHKAFAKHSNTKFDVGFRPVLYKTCLPDINTMESIPNGFTAKMKLYADLQAYNDRLIKEKTLQNITVTTRKKTTLEMIDEDFTSGLFRGDGYKFDISNTYGIASDVLHYLRGRVPGLVVKDTALMSLPQLEWRGSEPTFFINEIKASIEQVMLMSTEDIAYIKVFRPPFYGAGLSGVGGGIAIYMKRGYTSTAPGEVLEKQMVAGYTAVRQFYSPDYSDEQTSVDNDVRSTIYWNPNIVLSKEDNQIKLNFYNNDHAKKIRIIIEGMDEAGNLFRYTRLVE